MSQRAPVGEKEHRRACRTWSWSFAPTAFFRIGCDGCARDSVRVSILKESVLAEACSRKGQVNSGGNTKRFALVLEKGRELFVV